MLTTSGKQNSNNWEHMKDRCHTAQKMKFSIKDFFRLWSHLLKKSLMENFIFCGSVNPSYLEHPYYTTRIKYNQ